MSSLKRQTKDKGRKIILSLMTDTEHYMTDTAFFIFILGVGRPFRGIWTVWITGLRPVE